MKIPHPGSKAQWEGSSQKQNFSDLCVYAILWAPGLKSRQRFNLEDSRIGRCPASPTSAGDSRLRGWGLVKVIAVPIQLLTTWRMSCASCFPPAGLDVHLERSAMYEVEVLQLRLAFLVPPLYLNCGPRAPQNKTFQPSYETADAQIHAYVHVCIRICTRNYVQERLCYDLRRRHGVGEGVVGDEVVELLSFLGFDLSKS